MLHPVVNAANTAAVAVAPPQIPTGQSKDTLWLTLEVCREFQRNKCSRSDTECKYAHPPPHVDVQNGRVTACFDSIKGKCSRKEPPCKYLHPPQHLKEVLLQNGRRNLLVKNSRLLGSNSLSILSVPTYIQHPSYMNTPIMYELGGKTIAYPGGMLQAQTPVMAPQYYGHVQSQQLYPWQYINYPGMPLPVPMATDNSAALLAQQIPGMAIAPQSSVSTVTSTTPKSTHRDMLEKMDSLEWYVCKEENAGLIPTVKRVAIADKSGLPMYQPTMHMPAYQQALAMQLGHHYIPTVAAPPTYASHPATLPRF